MKVTVLGYTVVSTNCDNKFIVQSRGENSQDLGVIIDTIRKEAINTNLLKNDVEYSYRVIDVSGHQVITFVPLNKKKKNVFQKIFSNKKRTEI